MVPVNVPLAMKVSPVINAVTLFGSRLAEVSMPVTSKALTPPWGEEELGVVVERYLDQLAVDQVRQNVFAVADVG